MPPLPQTNLEFEGLCPPPRSSPRGVSLPHVRLPGRQARGRKKCTCSRVPSFDAKSHHARLKKSHSLAALHPAQMRPFESRKHECASGVSVQTTICESARNKVQRQSSEALQIRNALQPSTCWRSPP